MRGTARQTEDDATEDVGVESQLSLVFLEGLAPVAGCELEDAVAGPAREQAEQIAHVCEGLELVQATTRQQRYEGRVDLTSVVAADEERVFPSDVPGGGSARKCCCAWAAGRRRGNDDRERRVPRPTRRCSPSAARAARSEPASRTPPLERQRRALSGEPSEAVDACTLSSSNGRARRYLRLSHRETGGTRRPTHE